TLRAGRDPAGALDVLDLYRQRFPAGRLVAEASLARVEALLALGRRPEALSVVETMPDAPGERARDRALLRGELRAEAGRCTEALADFTLAESRAGSSLRPAVEARAVWGQAACHARLGQIAPARRDFGRYLAAYPRERSAADARRWLASHPE